MGPPAAATPGGVGSRRASGKTRISFPQLPVAASLADGLVESDSASHDVMASLMASDSGSDATGPPPKRTVRRSPSPPSQLARRNAQHHGAHTVGISLMSSDAVGSCSNRLHAAEDPGGCTSSAAAVGAACGAVPSGSRNERSESPGAGGVPGAAQPTARPTTARATGDSASRVYAHSGTRAGSAGGFFERESGAEQRRRERIEAEATSTNERKRNRRRCHSCRRFACICG